LTIADSGRNALHISNRQSTTIHQSKIQEYLCKENHKTEHFVGT
jgi:hypothetical protein